MAELGLDARFIVYCLLFIVGDNSKVQQLDNQPQKTRFKYVIL